MAVWRRVLAHMATDAEAHFDALKTQWGLQHRSNDPFKIVPYRGYGTSEKIYLKGRVIEDEGISPAIENESIWNNLVNMYKRFESDEVPGARVRGRFGGVEQEVVTDAEGFFEFWIYPEQPLPTDRLWHEVELELLSPLRAGHPPVRATGYVIVPPPGARFGVISDIDDTVVKTDATNLLRMARTVFLSNARTRLPFEGVAAFYRALQDGASGYDLNPLFYVSSSPWNLYDLLTEFFELQGIPLGPLMLRDWGISNDEVLPTKHRPHKLKVLRQILDLFPDLPFILIGDSGQEDPEIYRDIVRQYKRRILAVYIRNVSRDLERPADIRTLAKQVVAAGSRLILADDTVAAARHALEQGWIAPEMIPAIQVEKAADHAPPSPVETLLAEPDQPEAETPTVVVAGESSGSTQTAVAAGAVEAALEIGAEETETPPTVIVTGADPASPPSSAPTSTP